MTKQMNKFILPIIRAVKNLFDQTLNLKIKEGMPYILNNHNDSFDIVSVIGLSGEVKGSIVLALKQDVAIKIASKYWGKEIKNFDEDVYDTIGEIVNIIAGNAKQGVEDYKIYISLPNVFKGNNINTINFRDSNNIPKIMVPFNSTIGEMYIILSYKF